ncbi:MAG: primosomal protein N' [Phycisphaerales bacterium JB040]
MDDKLFPTEPENDETDAPAGATGEPAGAFVRVAVERGLDRSEGLTYRAPAGTRVGDRVEVPLGRGNSRAGGFVIATGGPELLGGFEASKVKRVLSVTGSRLPPELIELAEWLSEYYVCPLGMVLATMLPAAVKARVGRRTVRLLERALRDPDGAERAGVTPSARDAWKAIAQLEDDAFPIEPRLLMTRAGARNLGPINRLVEAGLLREVEVQRVRAPEVFWREDGAPTPAPIPEPTDAQRAVVEGVGLDRFGVHVVRGVTGSGKTEVYLRLIERVLGSGRTALVLVPEISLTPQTAGRFLERFSDQGVAVLHSGLTASQRHRQWASAAGGEARVVVGARSAVFAPLPSLGLIVVDEEHDSSYKQDQLPRYHARDVAVVRAQKLGVPVLLGSATPALETWANVVRGRYTKWELTERVGGAVLPEVRVVDRAREMARRRAEIGGAAQYESIGPTLTGALDETLRSGHQALLLLNRRGFASYVACPSAGCGWTLGCEQCDTSMVVHKGDTSRGYTRCHHCLAEQTLPRRCPVCGGGVIELGAGTQRVEKELESRFGTTHGLIEGEGFARVDSDTMRGAKDYFDVLGRFGRGELRVLLGTQMIAKGLDFPGVRLVGVLNADTGLSMPDFRATERTFQLVSQVAGRAGRRGEPGLVIVQTMNPDEPAIRMAATHDYLAFAERELKIRAAAGLPPAVRMARIVVRDEHHDGALDRAAGLAKALRMECGESVSVHGPAPCAIARVAGQFRFAIELLAPRPKDFQAPMARLRERGALKGDAHTAVDVDPVALL